MVFFFSSRRRHTRSTRDWSSDVCSSDLLTAPAMEKMGRYMATRKPPTMPPRNTIMTGSIMLVSAAKRSEERRVGKEGSARGEPDHFEEKNRQDEGEVEHISGGDSKKT